MYKMMKIISLLRFLLYIKLNKKIKSNGIVLLQKNVHLIVEEGGQIMFGKKVSIKENTIIYAKKNSTIIIGDNTSMGHNTEISANNYIDIGNDVIMGAYCYITDSNHGYRDRDIPIHNQPMESGITIVGNNVWIGRGSMILKDAKVGNNSIVAANSVVTKSFDDNFIIGGVPTKIIKSIYD